MIAKSSEREWIALSEQWFWGEGATAYTSVNSVYSAFALAQKAAILAASEGFGSLTLSITKDQLESHNEKRRKIVSFCNGIHYEASKLVDNPFSVKMSETAQKAYNLDPSDVQVQSGVSQNTLISLLFSTPGDIKLKIDFAARYITLNIDTPSSTLKEAMKEARFWDKEYEKAENCKKIAEEVFTDEVRKNWPTMTPEERQAIATGYANRIGQMLYGERSPEEEQQGIHPTVFTNFGTEITDEYSKHAFGVTYRSDNRVEINESFTSNPGGEFSIDNMIDTITHETRHAYQNEAMRNQEKYGVPETAVTEWQKPEDTTSSNPYYYKPKEVDARAFAALGRPE